MEIIEGGICAPKGFKAGAVRAGIRKGTKKLDVALIFSDIPAVAAGVFTKNKILASCVPLSRQRVSQGLIQACIINSGNANACTGPDGMRDSLELCSQVATHLKIPENSITISSTGVIGVPLPMNKIKKVLEPLTKSLSTNGSLSAANAIMTTDLYPKSYSIEMDLDGKKVRIGGIAKGSGMVHPNMATILGFITSDANITQLLLQQALKDAADDSFNMISVDGETSTNDMVIVLANGSAGNAMISSTDDPLYAKFLDGLRNVSQYLAKAIAHDGEGATKLVEVMVEGAKTKADARLVARTITASPLIKAAIFGNDTNWGRIACAVGYSGAEICESTLSIFYDTLQVLKDGVPLAFKDKDVLAIIDQPIVKIRVNLGVGQEQACGWGCDLSFDYIRINGSYRT